METQHIPKLGGMEQKKESAMCRTERRKKLPFFLAAGCEVWAGTAFQKAKDARMECAEKTKTELINELARDASAAEDMEKRVVKEAFIILGITVAAFAVATLAVPNGPVYAAVDIAIICVLPGLGTLWRMGEINKSQKELREASRPVACELLKREGIENAHFSAEFETDKISRVSLLTQLHTWAAHIRAWNVKDDGTEALAHFKISQDGRMENLLGHRGNS